MVKDKYPILTLALILLMIISFAMGVQSCGNDIEANKPLIISRGLDTTSERYDLQYKIYTLEGCEYIVVAPGNTHFTWGSHKGNCKNPIHQTK